MPSHPRVRWFVRLSVGAAFAGILLFPAVAPATIAEQRRRLPPPAHCEDPVEGVWRAHKWNDDFSDWVVFTLEVHRKEGSESLLEGTIENRSWPGTPQQEEAPPCGFGVFHWIVKMTAVGTITPEGDIRFGGTRWWTEQVLCNHGPAGYNLDNLSGRIDPALQEFQSVNNDGGRAINEPMVFRRIRCFDGSVAAPEVNPVPPDFYPGRSSGCGCGS